eukprot:1196386-Prorocentrum_minimum.AAC.5
MRVPNAISGCFATLGVLAGFGVRAPFVVEVREGPPVTKVKSVCASPVGAAGSCCEGVLRSPVVVPGEEDVVVGRQSSEVGWPDTSSWCGLTPAPLATSSATARKSKSLRMFRGTSGPPAWHTAAHNA